jgi:uncharacterized protein (TIGR01777 family)
MKVLVTGASGLIGSALVPRLQEEGHAVTRLVRHAPGEGEVAWDPEAGRLDGAALEGHDAVVHLAGENVAEGRWTPEKKARIRDSRLAGTRLLSETLARLERKPAVLASASAVGYYGSRGDELLREESPPGSDFLAGVCREWEAATTPAAEAGLRVVRMRFGIALSPHGGALANLAKLFQTNLGGHLGSGQQWISWIAIDDVAGAIRHLLAAEAVQGPVNVAAPNPARNKEFAQALGQVLHKPAAVGVPAFAARMAFGEMADAMLLASQRMDPARLVASGYSFQFPDLDPALRHLLGQ